MNRRLAKFKCLRFLLAALLFIAGPATARSKFALREHSQSQPSPNPPGKQAAPEQPIPFSHKRHTTLELPCKFCHENPEPGNLMNFPRVDTCMNCHESVAKDRSAIQKLVQYARSKETIPWVRVYVVPGFVYWSHRTHSEANISCKQCHGNVPEMDAMALTTRVTTMAGCVDCHKRNKAPTGCAACHAGALS